MTRLLRHIVVLLPTVLLLLPLPAAAQDLTALAVWQNQRGSTLSIDTWNPATGAITGTYINRAAGYSCIGTPYDVSGWILGNAIAWSVRWDNAYQNCNSVTAWAGYLAGGVITTGWVLATQTANLTGTDTFTQVAKTSAEALTK